MSKKQSANVEKSLDNNTAAGVSIQSNYEDVQYPSYAYYKTRPDAMALIAHLFGLKAPNFEKAKVLELGCASGGNLIPMAEAFPNATFVGIDLAENQVKNGQKVIQDLALKNIELKKISITDVTKDFGEFDYIIAHGIYSWVGEDVQRKLFEICNENLSENGVVYISYNTLPGWNFTRTVRDMMLFHTRKFSNPGDKVIEARRMLNFVAENTNQQSPLAAALKSEVNTLKNADDNYIYHDHLEDVNAPCYFEEFIENATKNNLQYLGDSDIHTMFLGNHTQKVQDTLSKVNNIVEQEQYLDFINNRRFRSTLLCHKSVNLSRTIDQNKLKDLFFASAYECESKDLDFSKDESIRFSNPNINVTFNSHNRYTLALLSVLQDKKGQFVSFNDIVDLALNKLQNVDKSELAALWSDSAAKLLFSGLIEASLIEDKAFINISQKPKVSLSASYLARTGSIVSNSRHRAIKIGDDVRLLVQYIDGTRTHDEIFDLYFTHFTNGDLVLNKQGKPIQEEKKLLKEVKVKFDSHLKFLAENALLVA